MTTHFPSVLALDAGDERLLREESSCLAVRKQAAVARALADQLERVALSEATGSLRGQLVEELARLGCKILETAAALSETTEPAPQSGLLPVSSDDITAAS